MIRVVAPRLPSVVQRSLGPKLPFERLDGLRYAYHRIRALTHHTTPGQTITHPNFEQALHGREKVVRPGEDTAVERFGRDLCGMGKTVLLMAGGIRNIPRTHPSRCS